MDNTFTNGFRMTIVEYGKTNGDIANDILTKMNNCANEDELCSFIRNFYIAVLGGVVHFQYKERHYTVDSYAASALISSYVRERINAGDKSLDFVRDYVKIGELEKRIEALEKR